MTSTTEKPFVMWDGEATSDGNYCLFGASTGHSIKAREGLSTRQCLDLILEVERQNPTAIHFGYSFGYDVNQIVKDIGYRGLILLRKFNHCHWQGYRIEYIPRKWFVVSKGKLTAKIFDVFLFFNCKYGRALRKYGLGTTEDLERIDAGKEERGVFHWGDIDRIENYWRTELRLGVQLMDKLREIIYGADFKITSWHGPGALASYALSQHKTQYHMDKHLEPAIIEASAYAMFGGRFQAFLAGYYEGRVYDRDINSAYAYAFSRLPSLSEGKWIHTDYVDPEDAKSRRIGIYRIRYASRYDSRAKPLPHRDSRGRVSFPPVTEGWYYAPEAALVCNDPRAKFMEAWLFEDNGDYPFSWIEDAFQTRLHMQQTGDPSEKTLKWMLAALYGQASQRAGWERKRQAPRWHQLQWAGTVTSECRAMCFMGARRAKESLVSIDTDGFISLAPVNQLPNGFGTGLGEWKATEYTGLLYLQNGIYWLRDDDGKWQEPKSRGIPRKKLEFSEVYPQILRNQNLEVSQHMFIGFGLALQQDITKWRTWVDIPRTITFGGNGKASHDGRICPTCKAGKSWGEAMHPLSQTVPPNPISHKYNLPWLTETIPTELEELRRWGIYDDD